MTQAIDGQPIEQGHVYVAAPDRHLLLIDGAIRLGEGLRENMVRPSIDPLFRSAALAFGPRTIGVVLTGMLNDGASGLHAIKSCGGIAVVQSPTDAEVEQMPVAALEATTVDHVVPAADLARLLTTLAGSEAGPVHPPTDDLRTEVQIAAGVRLGSDNLKRIAVPSALSCPDCQGVLSEMDGSSPLRYRCQIGHAYTAEVLAAHGEEVDEAIRIAMRADARRTGRAAVAELYEGRAVEYRRYAITLRDAAISTLRFGQTQGPQVI